VENPILFKTISNDPKWTSLRAIKEGRVFLIPRGPFSWLGHPTLTSLIGLKWLANILHPDLYPLDLKEETKYFTKLFFHVNLSDSEINDILNGAL
jgi:iron complex transport system substrate-binding protein